MNGQGHEHRVAVILHEGVSVPASEISQDDTHSPKGAASMHAQSIKRGKGDVSRSKFV